MNAQTIFAMQWPYLLSFFPPESELERTAREFGAIKRKRAVSKASDLLRLALAYGLGGMSLRQTAAWAQVAGVAELSDVALLNRLRSAADWLGYLLGVKLAERAPTPTVADRHAAIRVVDATVINGPDSQGTQWRVHLGLDLQRAAIDTIELTDATGGEQLGRFRFSPGELVLADRGYAHRAGLAHVRESGAHFIVRTNWKIVPLADARGKNLEVLAALRTLPEAAVADLDVRIKADPRRGLATLPARLVALRKSEAAAEKTRREILRQRRRPSRGMDPRSLEAAAYIYVLTSLPRETASAQQILALYQLRWQVEMAFKRLKGLIHLGELPIRDPRLARSHLYAKILSALALDDYTERFLALSPWGFDVTGAPTLPLENPARAD